MSGYHCDGCHDWQDDEPVWRLDFQSFGVLMGALYLYRFDSLACIRLWLDSRVTEAVR